MTKMICLNLQCSVYVFGTSSEECPDCGNLGHVMPSTQDAEFDVLYRKVLG